MVDLAGSESFAARFGRLREQTGLTQSAVASPRYTVSYVSQIESGRRTPSAGALAYFAARLGVSASYLETGTPDGLEDRLSYRIEEGRALLRGGEAQAAHEVGSEVRAESERYGLVNARARGLVLIADALSMLGRTREAIDRYEEALEDGLSERDQGRAVAALAAACRTVGDLSYAAELLESTLEKQRAAPLDPGVSAELQTGLVSVYFERGDVTRAERIARRALTSAAEASPSSRANVLWAASRVLSENKRWDEALELATEARVLIEGLNDRFRLAGIHNAYAFLCLEADPPRLEEARHHLEQAEILLGEDGPAQALAYVYTEHSRLALLSARPADALAWSDRALSKVGPDPLERARCLHLRGRALAELGRTRGALVDFGEAAVVFEKTGARQQAASCYREIGEIEFLGGDLEAAVEAFRAGLDVLEPRRSRA